MAKDWNATIIEEFRANGGAVGGVFEGAPLLLLTTTGARSGQPRVVPLMYHREEGRLFVFASKAGADTHPAWYHNLAANPQASVEIATDVLDVTASEVTGPERDRIYATHAERFPTFADYQANTERVIPVIALDPA